MRELTQILNAVEMGDAKAASQLFPLVYEELRKVAAQKMAREVPGQTLQPTALVHEAWLKLGGDAQPTWQNRAHFFGAAAEAMRRILVDRAREKKALKRGGDMDRVELDGLELAAPVPDDELLALDDAGRGGARTGRVVEHGRADLVLCPGVASTGDAEGLDLSRPTFVMHAQAEGYRLVIWCENVEGICRRIPHAQVGGQNPSSY
jgi:RNA polymerase sigma factor (TIGR02999 family)